MNGGGKTLPVREFTSATHPCTGACSPPSHIKNCFPSRCHRPQRTDHVQQRASAQGRRAHPTVTAPEPFVHLPRATFLSATSLRRDFNASRLRAEMWRSLLKPCFPGTHCAGAQAEQAAGVRRTARGARKRGCETRQPLHACASAARTTRVLAPPVARTTPDPFHDTTDGTCSAWSTATQLDKVPSPIPPRTCSFPEHPGMPGRHL